MKRKEPLNSAITLFGSLSCMSLVGYFLAGHDIWHDYASPEVWARAGEALPSWYSPANRCPLEWRVLQIGFLLMLVFHALLFVRRLLGAAEKTVE